MFKLTSDPTRYPYREVNLQDATLESHQVTTPAPGYSSTNELFQRPDRRRNISLGPRLSQIRLDLSQLDRTQVEGLYELTGMSASGNQRTPILLFPALDRNTILSAPLTQSSKAYTYAKSINAWQLQDATYSRGSTAYHRDDINNLAGEDSSGPMFNKSVIGNGAVIQSDYENLESRYEPTVGDVMWTAIGLGSAVWTTDRTTTRPASGGCTELHNVALATDTFQMITTIGAAAANEKFWYQVDLLGQRSTVDIKIGIGANSFTRTGIELTDDWQRITVGPVSHDGIATVMSADILPNDLGYEQTFYAGPVSVNGLAGTTTSFNPNDWTNIGTPGADSLIYENLPIGSATVTVYATGLMPEEETTAFLWDNGSAGPNWTLLWSSAGPSFEADGNFVSINIGALWVPGTPYMMVGRAGGTDVELDIAFQTDVTGTRQILRLNAKIAVIDIGPTQNDEHRIGGSGIDLTIGPSTVQNVHVLTRYMTDDEVKFLGDLYLEPGWQNIVADCGYRFYEATAIRVGPLRNKPDLFAGELVLSEIAPIAGMSYTR